MSINRIPHPFRKFQVIPDEAQGFYRIYALDSAGQIWFKAYGLSEWEKISQPEGTTEVAL